MLSEPIANLIGRADFFEHDIMVVPLSQVWFCIEHEKRYRKCLPSLIFFNVVFIDTTDIVRTGCQCRCYKGFC